MKKLIKHILKESSIQSRLLDVIVEDGIFDAADMVGGIDNLKRIFKDNPKIMDRLNALEGKLLMTLTFDNGRNVTLPFKVEVIGKQTTSRGNSWPSVNVKYDRNKFNDFENRQIESFIFDSEDQGAYEPFFDNYEKFQSDYAVQIAQINGKVVYDNEYVRPKYEIIRDIEDKLTELNSHSNKSEDTHKEEETEGAGGYAAPAFEMQPDHVHFKHLYNESEITEKCWKGYTQKGMKTMFGKKPLTKEEMKDEKIVNVIVKFINDSYTMEGKIDEWGTVTIYLTDDLGHIKYPPMMRYYPDSKRLEYSWDFTQDIHDLIGDKRLLHLDSELMGKIFEKLFKKKVNKVNGYSRL